MIKSKVSSTEKIGYFVLGQPLTQVAFLQLLHEDLHVLLELLLVLQLLRQDVLL